MTALAPGATIGILGGGQLGRMLALAAARLGLSCHVFAPEAESPAFQVSAGRTRAGYDDVAALERFAGAVDAVTYEFENVPVATVRRLETLRPVHPGSRALAVAQDRLSEKRLARELGAATADFRAVSNADDLTRAISEIGLPAILKTTRMGYDGKGQRTIRSADEAGAAFQALGGVPLILEGFVDFDCEVSVIAARASDGAFAAYDVTENLHRNHILRRSRVPARISAPVAAEARAIAGRIAEALDYVGVLGVEFFVAGERICVNEIAPRVHNSGHWTIDGALCSQFEQHIRAVAGWPLASAERHSDAIMDNLIGDEALDWAALAARPGSALHLYGKPETRPGRKMGHVTAIRPRHR